MLGCLVLCTLPGTAFVPCSDQLWPSKRLEWGCTRAVWASRFTTQEKDTERVSPPASSVYPQGARTPPAQRWESDGEGRIIEHLERLRKGRRRKAFYALVRSLDAQTLQGGR